MNSRAGKIIADQADKVAGTSAGLIRWIADPANAAMIGDKPAELIRTVRREGLSARRLRDGAQRKMSVGIFGPSQAGKSYLVSQLASREGTPLTLRIGDKNYDFLKEINPPGNRESTGLVTRFGIEPVQSTPDLPVHVRLLSQSDIVKIIGNSFFLDLDQNGESFQALKEQDVAERIQELRGVAGTAAVDSLSEDDVFDLSEYFTANFRGQTAHLRSGFWDEAIELAPRLDTFYRGRLWSLIWADFDPFTRLWSDLQKGLQQLQFASEANLSIGALIPREKSIIDVLTLDKLGTDSTDLVQIQPCGPSGPVGVPIGLARSLVCALTAELVTALSEKPWSLFDHADVLDFPGARSRLKVGSLDDVARAKGVAEGANPIRELLLRGKIAYLFQRYTVDRELSSIALCIPDGVQEVRDISDMMKAWIDLTIGDTPQKRARQRKSLLLVLTKMDREFEIKSGDTEDSRRARWTARLNSSLMKNFRGEWPTNWDNRPFNNTFWLRNPQIRLRGSIIYDSPGDPAQELSFSAEFEQQLATMREHFISNADVERHFAVPARAWDEGMKLNDGGVKYLIEALTPLCDENTKLNQDVQGLEDIKKRLLTSMERFYVPSDLDKRIAQRQEVANGVIDKLYLRKARLPLLLRGLQLDYVALREHLHRSVVRGEADRMQQPTTANNEPAPPIEEESDPDLIKPGKPSKPAAASKSQAPSAPRSPWAVQATGAALTLWDRAMNDIITNEQFALRVGIDSMTQREIVAELIAGARRQGLAQLMESEIGKVLHLDPDLGVAKATIVAKHLINRYVSELGTDRMTEADRPVWTDEAKTPVFGPRPVMQSIEGWSETQPRFAKDFLQSWAFSFYALVSGNAMVTSSSDVNPVQNQALGQLLGGLAAGSSAQ